MSHRFGTQFLASKHAAAHTFISTVRTQVQPRRGLHCLPTRVQSLHAPPRPPATAPQHPSIPCRTVVSHCLCGSLFLLFCRSSSSCFAFFLSPPSPLRPAHASTKSGTRHRPKPRASHGVVTSPPGTYLAHLAEQEVFFLWIFRKSRCFWLEFTPPLIYLLTNWLCWVTCVHVLVRDCSPLPHEYIKSEDVPQELNWCDKDGVNYVRVTPLAPLLCIKQFTQQLGEPHAER